MNSEIKDRVVFVTGSARRVGRAIALGFARQGAKLVVHHSSSGSAGEAQSTAEQIRSQGCEVLIVNGDQSKSENIRRIFAEIRKYYGRVDVMVNSAAVFKAGDFLEIDEEEWDLVMDVNLKGPFLLTQHAARLMRETGNGGVIINISDNSGLNGWARRPHHSISKAGVIMLTKVSALTLAEHKIRVNCVVPGPVLRPAGEPSSVIKGIAKALPVGHIGNPENIAAACIFLARNDFATGSIVRIDGGEGIAGGQT